MAWKVYNADKFDNFRKEWDQLNKNGPDSPVYNSAFITYSLREFGNGNERLAVYGDLHNPSAMTVLNKTKFGVWDTFQPSQVPLGAWLTNQKTEVRVLLKELMRALPGLVLKIGLTQQDPAIYPRPDDQGPISTLDYIQTARIEISESFEEYWASRGKNLRHNLKRQRNRLNKEEINLKLKVIRQAELVRQAIADYGNMESAGWKASEGTAISLGNAQGRFYTALLEEFCARQQGCIYQYFYDDQMVATDLCIIQNGVLVILKTTYDESISTSSPAFLMRQEAFEKIFSSGDIRAIEFYGKLMDWHTKWSNESRMLYHINYTKF